jgi:hypothetical protein
MPVYESKLAEACLPEPEDDFVDDWTDEYDDESDYWDLVDSLLFALGTDSLADHMHELELLQLIIQEWLAVLSDETDPHTVDGYLSFDYPPAWVGEYDLGTATAPGSGLMGHPE